MNAALGLAGVTMGLVAALAGATTVIAGLVRQRPELVRLSRTAAIGVVAGAVLAVAAMERALITRDFSLRFVAEHGSTKTPPLFNVATLWSALEGSILLWALVLAGYLALVVHHFRRRLTDPLVGWALATMLLVAAFFFAIMLGPANPFREVAGVVPLDGPGPNPLLQNHILMAIHPPILYLGFVGFTVPFAFAIAALATGRVGEGWLVETRRWTLFAWGFLTAGIGLGAWWSYEVLGWGGFWAWDPVENASFLPWLTGTAFIHSVMVQERRGMLRVWNLALLCATFSLTILGTFLTRSGVLDSVHAFTESGIGVWFLSFFGVVVLVSVGLIGWRGDRLRSPGSIDSPLSREASFLLNNVLFAVFAFAVLLGTVFPLVVEAINGDRLSIGRPYFDRMTVPIGLALLTMMAIAPVLPWRKASTELLRHRLTWPAVAGVATAVVGVAVGLEGWAPPLGFFLGGFAGGSAVRQLVLATRRQGWRGLVGRANGGMVVHLGVVVIAVALSSQGSFAKSAELTLLPGQTVEFAGHTLTYERMRETDDGVKLERAALISIDGGKAYAPAIQLYPNANQPIGVPSVRTGPLYDVYLSLSPPLPDDLTTGPVKIRALIMPLAVWLWIGGGIMAAGTILAAFPGRRRRPTDPVSAPVRSSTSDEAKVEVLA